VLPVASEVSPINVRQPAKASGGKPDQGSGSSPFEDMLDSTATKTNPAQGTQAAQVGGKPQSKGGTTGQASGAQPGIEASATSVTVSKTVIANSNTAVDPASTGGDADAQAALNAVIASLEAASKGAEADEAGTNAPAGATPAQTVAQLEGKIDGKSGDKSGSKTGAKTDSKTDGKSDSKSDKTGTSDTAPDGSAVPAVPASPVALAAVVTLGNAANQPQGQNAGAGDSTTIDAAQPHGQKAAIIQSDSAGNGTPASPKDAASTKPVDPEADTTASTAKAKSDAKTQTADGTAATATSNPADELIAALGQGQTAGSKRKADGQAPVAQDPDVIQAKDGGKASASSAANASDPAKAAVNASPPGQAGPSDTSAAIPSTSTDRLASDIAKSATSPHDHDAKSDDATKTASKSGVDNLQPMVLPPQTGAPSPAAATVIKVDATTANPTAVAIPVEGLAVAIASKADSGKKSFDIRLDPPELGRIHVQLDVDHNGQIATHVIADRSDTLDLLRRDSSGLERALQDAGLKTSSNGLQFSLRDQGYSGGNQQWPTQTNTPVQNLIISDETSPILPSTYRSLASVRSGVDIRV
jgi:flagellar hook-length control protein FliK